MKNGEDVQISYVGDELFINASRVVAADIKASNGREGHMFSQSDFFIGICQIFITLSLTISRV